MKLFSSSTAMTECIGCGGQASAIGEIPFSYHFLENQLSTPLDTGDLYECSVCGLWFKHPYLSESEIAAYYKSSSDKLAWYANDLRQDFAAVKAILTENFPQGGAVLDFGCYMGEFLNLLPDRFTKQGVEPSLSGSKAASTMGIEILGSDLAGLGKTQFHAITLFDVFEHLTDPVGTLDLLFSHLLPGGVLCVVTGIADHPLFHAAGSKYNYVCLPEHVCFLTRKFAAFLGERYRSNYQLSTLSKNHGNLRLTVRATAINLVNSPMLVLRSKKAISKLYSSRRMRVIASKGLLPMWSTEDHALMVLRK